MYCCNSNSNNRNHWAELKSSPLYLRGFSHNNEFPFIFLYEFRENTFQALAQSCGASCTKKWTECWNLEKYEPRKHCMPQKSECKFDLKLKTRSCCLKLKHGHCDQVLEVLEVTVRMCSVNPGFIPESSSCCCKDAETFLLWFFLPALFFILLLFSSTDIPVSHMDDCFQVSSSSECRQLTSNRLGVVVLGVFRCGRWL